MNKLDRWKLLAAETFSYSYDNYADHRGNLRFDEYMPNGVRVLDRANRESWETERLARELEVAPDVAAELLVRFRDALEVVDAPNPAESFRRSVRQAIQRALKEGLATDEQVESLVIQVCYRGADLSYLLQLRNERLHRYSDLLRREPDVIYYDDPEGY
jgi:hypothetical protein